MSTAHQEYSEEILKKMRHWGVVKEQDYVVGFPPSKIVFVSDGLLNFDNYLLGWHTPKAANEEEQNLRTRVNVLETCCALLTQKIQELEKRDCVQEEPNESERIYSEHKSDIEKKYFGKIIAIDNAKRKVAGSGDTILEAYHDAKKNEPDRSKFSYIRVGYTDRL